MYVLVIPGIGYLSEFVLGDPSSCYLGFAEGANTWVPWAPRLKSWEYKMRIPKGGA